VEIGCIVEGDGERDALPVLLRRVIRDFDPALDVRILRPYRLPKGQFRKQGALRDAIQLVVGQLTPPRALLVLIDADDDCPAVLGPGLLAWVQSARPDVPSAVVVANREYEAWFLAAAESLRGHRGLAGDLSPPPAPETISGAKEWLTRHMPTGQPYAPVRHQASFSAVMDLQLARQRAPSFDKLSRDIRRLMKELRAIKV
jgi:hypothetical protein